MLSKIFKRIPPISMLALSLSALPAYGEEAATLTVRGFGTLGAARSSSSDVEFIRNLSQPKGIKDGQWSGRTDSILGIQANWQISPGLELTGQVVSKSQYDASRTPALEWGFLKWVPDDRVSLRAGRIGADLMMLADSRLVGYSYLTARPPVDFFGPLFFSSFDGVDGSITLAAGNGLIRSKAFAGNIEEKATGTPGIWDTSGSPIFGFVVDYFLGNWQFRASSTNIEFSNNLNFDALTTPLYSIAAVTGITAASAAADALNAKGTETRYYSVGTVYDNGPLQIQASVNKITHETATFQNSVAGYLLGSYRVNSLTPYLGVSRWKSTFKQRSTGLPYIPQFAPLIESYQTLMNASSADQTTYSAGVRWDFLPKIAMKFQWDTVHAAQDSIFPYAASSASPNWNGRTNVTSITLDFIF